MAILGLLLLLSAVGVAVDVAWQNAASVTVDALGQTFSLSSGWLFVAGVATGAVGLLGLTMLVAAMTRARRRRAGVAESRSNMQGLQAERDRLAAELERERASRGRADESVIDLHDDRRADPVSADYEADRGTARRDERVADRREPVESGRHGLFNRRH